MVLAIPYCFLQREVWDNEEDSREVQGQGFPEHRTARTVRVGEVRGQPSQAVRVHPHGCRERGEAALRLGQAGGVEGGVVNQDQWIGMVGGIIGWEFGRWFWNYLNLAGLLQ